MSSNTKPRTILRIKRRRTDEPLPYLRLEGLDGRMKRRRGSDDNEGEQQQSNLSDLFQNAANIDESHKHKAKRAKHSAVWKRLSPDNEENHSYRVVDALLENDGPQTKRRKLTVLETSAQNDLPSNNKTVNVRRKTGLKVLDPLSRLVDDSLQQVHIGSKSISDHYRFIRMDPRLAHEFHKWVGWCHSSGGNILHACAMWNDVEIASDVLQLTLPVALTEAGDGDGRTPYELAQLSGHDSVCQVLEAFGGDTTNYVYDIFCLEEGDNDDNDEGEDGKEHQTMSVELTSGVGYWTPHGDLILEAPEKFQASLNHVFDDGDEIDSNCEEYGGNDYPDEDEDDTSWAEAFGPDQGFRHHHVDFDDSDDYYDDIDAYD